MNRIQHLEQIQKQARELFARKNKDYGDAFAKHGPVGVLIRIGDKLDRYISVSNTSVNLVKDEKLRDTLIDMHNYAAMAIMLLDKPKTGADGYFLSNDRMISEL